MHNIQNDASTMAPNHNKATLNNDNVPSRIQNAKPVTAVPTMIHNIVERSPRQQLERLEGERDRQRQRMEDLGRQKLEIDNAMTKLARTLEQLDQDIESIEIGILQSTTSTTSTTTATTVVKTEATSNTSSIIKSEKGTSSNTTNSNLTTVKAESSTRTTNSDVDNTHNNHNDDIKSDIKQSNTHTTTTISTTKAQANPYSHSHKMKHHTNVALTMTTQYDDNEILTDPNGLTMTMAEPSSPPHHHHNKAYWTAPNDNDDDDDFQLYDDDDDDVVEYDPDEHDENAYVESYTPPQQRQQQDHRKVAALETHAVMTTARTNAHHKDNVVLVTGTIMSAQSNHDHSNGINTSHPIHDHPNVVTPLNNETVTYPWTTKIFELLQNAFRIPSFREQQLDIINTTMQGLDVFVIMRTGGGKSLTYQLPALYEGRFGPRGGGHPNKVTLVISPLLSLIQDQEEQMNLFAPGSAISFTSSIGAAEHNRRWSQVQDPQGGVCIIFCTPEKVSKSNRLCSELDKLHARNRLGRFVIDEAHCACQWGHDFRPDYAKLGKLKSHFPSVPIIAVTATASDRVRDDVCEILRIRHDYHFFRSTFSRPNLIYSVVPKPDKNDAIVELMVNFIKTKYPRDAGIVYTFSRKEANTIADALCSLGVIAEVRRVYFVLHFCSVFGSKPFKLYLSLTQSHTIVM